MDQEKAIPQTAKATLGRREQRKLRNILIHKPLQREFTFVIMGLMMVSILAISFVIHTTIGQAGAYQFGKISPYEILSEVRYELLFRISLVLIITMMIMVVFGVFFLHRVAGPVYRFRLVFLSLNQGHLPTPIKLREGDFFVEAATEINKHLERLTHQHTRLREIKEKARLASSVQELKVLLESLPS